MMEKSIPPADAGLVDQAPAGPTPWLETAPSHSFLTDLLDHIPTGVAVLDGKGELVLANHAACRLLDLEKEGSAALPSALRGFVQQRGLDGPAGEAVVLTGPQGRLLSFSLSRLGDSVQGETAYLVALIEDVTFQVHLGAQRERTHTLSAMGEMAAEVAHQIRNPLGGIELFASILGREVKGEPGLERLVSQVLGGAQEINHLINNYLALARPHQPIKKPVSVARLIEEAIQAAGDALQQKGIQTRVNAAEEAWVEGDEELLLQVFLNLVLNAVEALNPGGRLTVALSADRRRVEIRLTDTGRGIEPRDLDRLFNPFFTTKDKTLGLGLAVSHRIIDAHQGLIQVQGRPHQGATVTVTLPAMAMAPGRTSLL